MKTKELILIEFTDHIILFIHYKLYEKAEKIIEISVICRVPGGFLTNSLVECSSQAIHLNALLIMLELQFFWLDATKQFYRCKGKIKINK